MELKFFYEEVGTIVREDVGDSSDSDDRERDEGDDELEEYSDDGEEVDDEISVDV